MTTASSIPDAIDMLYQAFTVALPANQVYDGPDPSSEYPTKCVIIGLSDPDGDSPQEAAASTQQWAWIGHVQRDEEVTVHCVAVSWSGDTNMKAVRDGAFSVVKVLTDTLTSDPTLYGTVNVLWVNGVDTASLIQGQDSRGAYAYLPFDVHITSRLA